MRIEKVVVNASPLITLFRAGLDPLLPQLFPDLREVEITNVPFSNVIVGAALAAKLKYIAAKAAPTVVLGKLVRL